MDFTKITSWLKLIAALITAILTVLGSSSVIQGNPGAVEDTQTTAVVKTKTVVDEDAPASPEQVAEAPPAGELQSSPEEIEALRDSTPDGVPEKILDEAEQATDQYVEDFGVEEADTKISSGGAQGYSCRKSYASGGFGSFRSHFVLFGLHYTVSGGRGWDVLYNMKRYLESVGLSATFIVDLDGRCLQTVPLDRNPYTQGGFNQYTVSVEIIATGKEPTSEWMAAPLIKRGVLAALVRDTLKSHGLPIRFVDPVGCTPLAGYTDHNHLECGNNHVDVSPYFPWTFFNRQVQAKPKPLCDRRCKRKIELRKRHGRVHERFARNDCVDGKRDGSGHPKVGGLCQKLRNQNKRIHLAVKKYNRLHPRRPMTLKGTVG